MARAGSVKPKGGTRQEDLGAAIYTPSLLAETRPTAHEYRSVSSPLFIWNEASWLRYGNYVLSVNRCVVGFGRHGGRLHSLVLLRPSAPRGRGHPEVDRDGGSAGRAYRTANFPVGGSTIRSWSGQTAS